MCSDKVSFQSIARTKVSCVIAISIQKPSPPPSSPAPQFFSSRCQRGITSSNSSSKNKNKNDSLRHLYSQSPILQVSPPEHLILHSNQLPLRTPLPELIGPRLHPTPTQPCTAYSRLRASAMRKQTWQSDFCPVLPALKFANAKSRDTFLGVVTFVGYFDFRLSGFKTGAWVAR